MVDQFHKVSDTEFVAFVNCHSALVDWLGACEFMRSAYGEQAYSLEAEFEEDGYYDDENYADCFTRLAVFDQAGNELEPDVTRPYWKDVIAPGSKYRYYVETEEEAARDRIFDHEEPPIATKSATYIIDQPPCEMPEVYIRVK